jgi:hypothetical protein
MITLAVHIASYHDGEIYLHHGWLLIVLGIIIAGTGRS